MSVRMSVMRTVSWEPTLNPFTLGRTPTVQTGQPIKPATPQIAAATLRTRISSMRRVMNRQTIRLVNADAPKPNILSPDPGAIFRGQLSPTRITNAAVKSIGIAKGSSTFTKNVGGTIGRDAKVFVTTHIYRTVGLRNHLCPDMASGGGGDWDLFSLSQCGGLGSILRVYGFLKFA